MIEDIIIDIMANTSINYVYPFLFLQSSVNIVIKYNIVCVYWPPQYETISLDPGTAMGRGEGGGGRE